MKLNSNQIAIEGRCVLWLFKNMKYHSFFAAKTLRIITAAVALSCGEAARPEEKTVLTPKWRDEVTAFFGKSAYEAALKRLDEVPEEEQKNYLYCNFKGAALVALRRFSEARPLFKQSLELSAGDVQEAYHPKFNLAEVDFVEQKWAPAEAAFKELQREPWRSHKTEGQPSSLPLVYFKVCVCQIMTKRNAEAAATYRELKGLTEDQAAGASEAVLVALDFQQKKKSSALKRLEALRKAYPKKETDLYEDTFIELGWVTNAGKGAAAPVRPNQSPSRQAE